MLNVIRCAIVDRRSMRVFLKGNQSFTGIPTSIRNGKVYFNCDGLTVAPFIYLIELAIARG